MPVNPALNYQGRFPFFEFDKVRTYPIRERENKVTLAQLVDPVALQVEPERPYKSEALSRLVAKLIDARAKRRPVMVFTGAHLIKNGMGPLLIDLMRRGWVTLVAMNAAGFTHDLELALIGQTSECVPNGLAEGAFGMCRETPALMNGAWRAGLERRIGGGEALGRLIAGEPMPEVVAFPHRAVSVAAAGIQYDIPVTLHASLGTDVIDQHACFDPEAKGAVSGFDFGVFAAQVCEAAGGVFLNFGSSVQGPEVFLKAVSMAANIGRAPMGLTSASFDIRPVKVDDADNERSYTYYFRDHKSVVVRIPQAFGGEGFYIQGDHLETIPALYREWVRASS